MNRLAAIALAGAFLVALPSGSAVALDSYVFATTTDFSTGAASWVELGPPRVPHLFVESLCSDPVCRWAFGRVYVVNRFGCDNIQVLDPGNSFVTLLQFSVGNGSNPQDIAVLSPTKAYVSRLGSTSILIVNPVLGTTLGSISLAAFSDADGLPEAHKMLVYGDRVFVTLQRLDNFVPTDSALVVAIDTATDALLDADPVTPGVQGILLAGTNPNTDLVYDAAADRILVGTTGAFGALDGGIDVIDPLNLVSLGFETSEAQLGGDLNDIALAPNGRAYAMISDASFNTLLVRYDRADGSLADTLFAPGGFTLADMEINDRGELWICDRNFAAPGLRVFDTTTDAALAGPIDVGLPPFDITFDSFQVVDEPPPGVGGTSGLRIVAAGPNPTTRRFTLRFSIGDERSRATRLEIFNALGARIDRVEGGELGPGTHSLGWSAGKSGRPGVYFFRLVRGGETASGRFVLIP